MQTMIMQLLKRKQIKAIHYMYEYYAHTCSVIKFNPLAALIFA